MGGRKFNTLRSLVCPSSGRKVFFRTIFTSFPIIVLKFKRYSLLDVTFEWLFRCLGAEVEKWHPIISSQFYLPLERFLTPTSAEFHTSLTFFFIPFVVFVVELSSVLLRAVWLIGKYESQRKKFTGVRSFR